MQLCSIADVVDQNLQAENGIAKAIVHIQVLTQAAASGKSVQAKAEAFLLTCRLVSFQALLLVAPRGGILDQPLAQLVSCVSQLLDFAFTLQLLLSLQIKALSVLSGASLLCHTQAMSGAATASVVVRNIWYGCTRPLIAADVLACCKLPDTVQKLSVPQLSSE